MRKCVFNMFCSAAKYLQLTGSFIALFSLVQFSLVSKTCRFYFSVPTTTFMVQTQVYSAAQGLG